jgi:hypothetical protein
MCAALVLQAEGADGEERKNYKKADLGQQNTMYYNKEVCASVLLSNRNAACLRIGMHSDASTGRHAAARVSTHASSSSLFGQHTAC